MSLLTDEQEEWLARTRGSKYVPTPAVIPKWLVRSKDSTSTSDNKRAVRVAAAKARKAEVRKRTSRTLEVVVSPVLDDEPTTLRTVMMCLYTLIDDDQRVDQIGLPPKGEPLDLSTKLTTLMGKKKSINLVMSASNEKIRFKLKQDSKLSPKRLLELKQMIAAGEIRARSTSSSPSASEEGGGEGGGEASDEVSDTSEWSSTDYLQQLNYLRRNLDPWQQELFDGIVGAEILKFLSNEIPTDEDLIRDDFLVGSTTSSGKSFVARLAAMIQCLIRKALGMSKSHVIFVVPNSDVLRETMVDLGQFEYRDRRGSHRMICSRSGPWVDYSGHDADLGELASPALPPGPVVVLTPEVVDEFLMDPHNAAWLEEVGTVVLDEVHQRDIATAGHWASLLPGEYQMIWLSATLGDMDEADACLREIRPGRMSRKLTCLIRPIPLQRCTIPEGKPTLAGINGLIPNATTKRLTRDAFRMGHRPISSAAATEGDAAEGGGEGEETATEGEAAEGSGEGEAATEASRVDSLTGMSTRGDEIRRQTLRYFTLNPEKEHHIDYQPNLSDPTLRDCREIRLLQEAEPRAVPATRTERFELGQELVAGLTPEHLASLDAKFEEQLERAIQNPIGFNLVRAVQVAAEKKMLPMMIFAPNSVSARHLFDEYNKAIAILERVDPESGPALAAWEEYEAEMERIGPELEKFEEKLEKCENEEAKRKLRESMRPPKRPEEPSLEGNRFKWRLPKGELPPRMRQHVKDLLVNGAGLYTEDRRIGRRDRSSILSMFGSGLQLLFSGPELRAGVNLPARTVLVTSTDRRLLNKIEYDQMGGRAGRRGLDDRGFVIYMGQPEIARDCYSYTIPPASLEFPKTPTPLDAWKFRYVQPTPPKIPDWARRPDIRAKMEQNWLSRLSDVQVRLYQARATLLGRAEGNYLAHGQAGMMATFQDSRAIYFFMLLNRGLLQAMKDEDLQLVLNYLFWGKPPREVPAPERPEPASPETGYTREEDVEWTATMSEHRARVSRSVLPPLPAVIRSTLSTLSRTYKLPAIPERVDATFHLATKGTSYRAEDMEEVERTDREIYRCMIMVQNASRGGDPRLAMRLKALIDKLRENL